jgi:hypothetical protein
MKRSIRLFNRSLFALGILGALTFGASEVFASSKSGEEAARPWCEPVKCNAECGGYGICSGFNCLCY